MIVVLIVVLNIQYYTQHKVDSTLRALMVMTKKGLYKWICYMLISYYNNNVHRGILQ